MADRQKKEQAPQRRMLRPLSTCVEQEGQVLLQLDMPGVKKEGLDIQVEDYELRIVGHREPRQPQGRYLVKERPHGDFVATYTIDDTVDSEKVEASFDNGVLTVVLHLKEEVKPRKIEVKTS